MNKKGMGTGAWILLAAVVVIVGIIGYVAFFYTPAPGGGGGDPDAPPSACPTACPDDKDWVGTINNQNKFNTSGSETFDSTIYFFHQDGSLKTSITDTTSGAATLACGETYSVETIGTSGAGGDGSELFVSPKDCKTNDDGSATCLACGTGSTWTFKGGQHGLPKVRAKDEVQDAFAYDTGDASATDYETTDGVVFTGSTDNTTCTTVDSGGNLKYTLYIKANVEDEDVNDLGMYILVDAAIGTWDEPTAHIDGTKVSEASGQLNADESKAYADYEYVYKVAPDREIIGSDELEFMINIDALSGQDPTGANNLSIDLAPIARYASQEETNVVKIGSVDDSPSRSAIHTLFDTVICTA